MATGTGVCETPRITVASGPRKWSLKRDVEGHRTYSITHRIEVDRNAHGPYSALELTPGLPEPGAVWTEGDYTDEWAFFTQEAEVVQVGREAGNCYFDITQYATTRPTLDCVTDGRENPLLQPDRVRVESINYQKEASFDRNGVLITNSAWEQLRGPQVEFDAHRLRVIVEQNVPELELDLIASLLHHLNDATLWGFAARAIKLSAFEAEPKYHSNCDKYWLRRLTFDVADDFDRCVLDEGTKVLIGKWDKDPASATYGLYLVKQDEDGPFGYLDPDDPKNFMRYKDWHNENTRVILNGNGIPWDPLMETSGTDDDTAGEICIQYYPEGNMNLLGLPADLETGA